MEHIKNTRIKLFYVFETLLCSGMRIGELTSIVFNKNLPNRIITSKISGNKLVEIIINTEKTCKMRERYTYLMMLMFSFAMTK
ncbi:MAG: hypothetical protein MJ223_02720 [Mycoplasmoidaceae bacterium]|nr:hypothetical protein [Mycoplasmoidaceae bacterium]